MDVPNRLLELLRSGVLCIVHLLLCQPIYALLFLPRPRPGPCVDSPFLLIVGGFYSGNTMRNARSKGVVYTRHQSETKASEQIALLLICELQPRDFLIG
jgi:hypothetical protein